MVNDILYLMFLQLCVDSWSVYHFFALIRYNSGSLCRHVADFQVNWFNGLYYLVRANSLELSSIVVRSGESFVFFSCGGVLWPPSVC